MRPSKKGAPTRQSAWRRAALWAGQATPWAKGGVTAGGTVPGAEAANAVKAEFLEELVQGDARDAHAKGLVDEIDQVGARRFGTTAEEFGNGSSIAWQQLAVGATVHTVVGLLDRFQRRDRPCWPEAVGRLTPTSRAIWATLSPDLGVEQEMAEQAGRVAVVERRPRTGGNGKRRTARRVPCGRA